MPEPTKRAVSELSDADILRRWRDEPAPLLPVLHAFHDRDGYLSEQALRAISAGLRIPLADLFGTVTFYHHFSRSPGGRDQPRVCDGPICQLHGTAQLTAALSDHQPTAMPCAGRCDQPIPVLRGDQVLVGTTAASLSAQPSPLPPPNPGGIDECVFAHIRDQDRAQLEGYGGYTSLTQAIESMSPEQLLEVIDSSGLAGRGGAGFPTGRKWRAVADAPGMPKTIVCNADEGEPGCFKDRVLMDHDPHALIEGMAIAALATGAERGFIYLRYEYPDTEKILTRAIAEAVEANLLGNNILRRGMRFNLHVRRGAGAYICGEETSLLNSLEGKHPFPRNRPPYPVTHGYENLPTVVNNVETLCAVPPIIEYGAEWYQALGKGKFAGTKIISLSGDVQKPGNYEVPLGLPLATLLNDWAGGPQPGRSIQAVTMAGLSGGFIAGDDLDRCTLDEPCLRSMHSFLGAGGVMVLDDSRDMMEVSRQAMSFFAHESCGKCFPCRIGTQRLTERLALEAGPRDFQAWRAEVEDIGETMKATSACGLGIAAPLITDSLIRYFSDVAKNRFDK
ncbi:MAG: NAD(P)H-dependent oxidoreductase subunit E [Proteobacteria bacterium]|nr:NAD(P)H-dependent oxidoreductase subunit E [Pseudomonadota bacterium]